MGVKERIQNWRTKSILEREERKAEREEERAYMKGKKREAKEIRRQANLTARGEAVIRKAKEPRVSIAEKFGNAFGGLGGTPTKKGKSQGLDFGGFGSGLSVEPNFDLGFGSSRRRKGKRRRSEKFGGFI